MTQESEYQEQEDKETSTAEEMQQTAGSLEQAMQTELQEWKDKYLRLLAESENTRKRLLKEKQEMTRFSVENVLAEFLPPIDNLENALGFAQKMSEETANWARGFQMILDQFKEVLVSNGIVAFSSVGKMFNPHCHEAMETEENATVQEGEILQEYVKGYKSGERTVRPARVKVAKKPVIREEKTSEE